MDLSTYDTSKQLPDSVWPTVPAGQSLLKPSAAWEKPQQQQQGDTLIDPALYTATQDGSLHVYLAYIGDKHASVGLAEVAGFTRAP